MSAAQRALVERHRRAIRLLTALRLPSHFDAVRVVGFHSASRDVTAIGHYCEHLN